ncbi:MAG TPA: methionine--tRNA ligase [Blastocatellia bacterium]|nr:methionine--tRNA ligase [Blastocatellia bacterium]
MTNMEETFYVTTPIYYVNARPHLGHVYTTLVADSLAMFKRQRGIATFFLTGTDEHGISIERAAAARGIPVKQHVDEIVDEFKAAFAKFNIRFDRWIRTTDDFHEAAVQELWRMLEERGHIYKGRYEGWFCGYCNEYKDVEQNVEHPICPQHDRPLDRVEEESYFFRLSGFQDRLLELYDSNPDFVQPDVRRNEVRSFVAGGLKDLSISRASVKWGIPVPGNPSHTIYVWLDALSNYITALGWGNERYKDFGRYWPALHLVGKDIVRFHAVYWPAFLMGAGVELPRQVFAHGMWLSGGRKMSKTLGNTVDLSVLHAHFTPDMIRYFVLREMSFGQDGDFTYEALIDRANADLADGLGNLASRTLTMVKNYFEGQPPRRFDDAAADAVEVREAIEQARARFRQEYDALSFSRAIEAVWAAIARIDKFITDNQPWKLAKDSSAREQLERVIATAYEGLRHVVLLAAPVLPETTVEIWRQMGLAGEPLKANPDDARWGEAVDVSRIERVSPAFPKLNKEKIMAEIENQKEQPKEAEQPVEHATTKEQEAASPAGATQAAAPPVADKISIDDFVKVELRVATVLEAERVPKADRLLKLKVDVGEAEPRQLLAGIAEHYAPEDVIGRKIIVVANLAPRKLRGLESNGMLLAASVGEDGKPVLATFAEDVPNGARLK